MDLFLTRISSHSGPNGIFGVLYNFDRSVQLMTLEHAYEVLDSDGSIVSYEPKIAPGVYLCVRGIHRLEGMLSSFETFEVTGLPDFQGKPVTKVLLHVGNYQRDSSGCVLVGMSSDLNMIHNSKEAFSLFMNSQKGCDTFTLVVS